METNKGTQNPQQGTTPGRQENEQTQPGTPRQNEQVQSEEEMKKEEGTPGTQR